MKNRYRTVTLLAGAAVILAAGIDVRAWGAKGHQVVAMIAEAHLTPKAAQAVAGLLAQEGKERVQSLPEVSTWADQIRSQSRDTGPWHYVNLPAGASKYDRNRDCPGDTQEDCVVERIDFFRRVLANKIAPPAVRSEALKFLVHLVADLHQPLHVGYANDRGGNSIKVQGPGSSRRSTNLHALWDTTIINRRNLTARVHADELLKGLLNDPARLKSWQAGTPSDWANEARVVLERQVYSFKVGSSVRLDEDYYRVASELIDLQLARGGIRLARLLNETLQ